MPHVVIDGLSINTEDLSADAVGQIEALKFISSEIKRLENEIHVYRVAFLAQKNEVMEEIERLGLVAEKDKDAAGFAE